MCDYFDDFDGEFDEGEFMEGDFCEDHYERCMDDCEMEDTAEPDPDYDLNQDDAPSDGFTWDDSYWTGVGLGFAYEEGRRERRSKKKAGSVNSPEFD